MAATAEAPAPASSVRTSSVTSSPSRKILSSPSSSIAKRTSSFRAILATRFASCSETARLRADMATSLYSAPLSSRCQPSVSATRRAIVPLPDPLGPSIAITGAFFKRPPPRFARSLHRPRPGNRRIRGTRYPQPRRPRHGRYRQRPLRQRQAPSRRDGRRNSSLGHR